MSKKKQAREELLNTHVINIKEIREAERREKNVINKRKALKYSLVGVLLIVMGYFYPTFMGYITLNNNDNLAIKRISDNNTLTCVSNIDYREQKIKVSTKTVYTFYNNKIYKSVSNAKITLFNSNEYNILNDLKNKYSEMYKTNDYISYNYYNNTNSLMIDVVINSYNSNKVIENYNPELDNLTHTYLFKGTENINDVKSKLESIGNLCNRK